MLKPFLSFIFACSMFGQPNCQFTFTLTTAGQTFPQNSQGFNNQVTACQYWTVSFFSTGFSAASLRFDSAPIGNSPTVPGTFIAFAGTLVGSSVNPSTAITQDSNSFKGMYPFVQVELTSITGTGSITGVVYGYRNQPVNYGPSNSASNSFGGGMCSIYPQATCSPSLPTFAWLNQASATVVTATSEETITVAKPNTTGDTGGQMYSRVINVPASTPWSVTMAFSMAGATSNSYGGFIMSDGTKGVGAGISQNGTCNVLLLAHWSTITTNVTSVIRQDNGCMGDMGASITWIKVRNDGTNLTLQFSVDGKTFLPVDANFFGISEAANALITTPTKIGYFMADLNGNYSEQITLKSFTVGT